MKKLALGILFTFMSLPAFSEVNYSAELLSVFTKHETMLEDTKAWGEEYNSSNIVSGFGLRGVYSIGDLFSIELAYLDYGDNEEDFKFENVKVSQKISTTTINVGIKSGFRFYEDFLVYLRLGTSFWKIKADIDLTAPYDALDETDRDRNFYQGLGLQYKINPHYSVGTEYTYTDMWVFLDGFKKVEHTVRNISVSLAYHF